MHQLRERRLTFAGNCYRCEDQPVKHLVLWEGRAGKMLRGQTTRMTYVKQLLHEQHDSCCEMIHELQRMIKNRVEWARVSHTTSSSEWLRSLRKWMDGWIRWESRSPLQRSNFEGEGAPHWQIYGLPWAVQKRLNWPRYRLGECFVSFSAITPTLLRITSGYQWRRFLTGRMSFLPPNHQCQSTEGNTKHGPQPAIWPHPFFIHHQTLDGTGGIASFLSLQADYCNFGNTGYTGPQLLAKPGSCQINGH